MARSTPRAAETDFAVDYWLEAVGVLKTALELVALTAIFEAAQAYSQSAVLPILKQASIFIFAIFIGGWTLKLLQVTPWVRARGLHPLAAVALVALVCFGGGYLLAASVDGLIRTETMNKNP